MKMTRLSKGEKISYTRGWKNNKWITKVVLRAFVKLLSFVFRMYIINLCTVLHVFLVGFHKLWHKGVHCLYPSQRFLQVYQGNSNEENLFYILDDNWRLLHANQKQLILNLILLLWTRIFWNNIFVFFSTKQTIFSEIKVACVVNIKLSFMNWSFL